MKSFNLYILTLLAPVLLYGQIEPENYKEVSRKFQTAYNNGDYESIFNMFSPEMQAALPREKTQAFVQSLQQQAGLILNMQLHEAGGIYNRYKTQFEKGIFSLNIALDSADLIKGLYLKPFREQSFPTPERNVTGLILPLKGEWTVIWGGDTRELNYHVESEAQKNAFDLVITDESGNSHKSDGKANEDYYAFGQDIIAPCQAEVVLVVDGIKDNKPGIFNPMFVTGNTVILKTAANEYLIFAHFKKHSIAVKEGDTVKQGQLLGLCGNSGNSSEPHLHFHIQNVEDLNVGTGIKCYFGEIMVDGVKKEDYSPIQGEKIINAD